jgi:hypothetical protein
MSGGEATDVRPARGRVLRREIILALVTCSFVAAMALGMGAQAQGRIRAVVSAQVQVLPTSGPGGTQIAVRATGLSTSSSICSRYIGFWDASGLLRVLKYLPITDHFRTKATIPMRSALGLGTVVVNDAVPFGTHCAAFTVASTGFTVTG